MAKRRVVLGFALLFCLAAGAWAGPLPEIPAVPSTADFLASLAAPPGAGVPAPVQQTYCDLPDCNENYCNWVCSPCQLASMECEYYPHCRVTCNCDPNSCL